MPYSADLRCGFIKLEMNSNWVHEVMSDHGLEIVFSSSPDAEKYFNEHLDRKITKYIEMYVFGKEKNIFDSIWEYIYETVIIYELNNPLDINICKIDEETN